MVMNWNDEQQQRFDELRLRKLTQTLSSQEQQELDALVALLETDERKRLEPAIEKMRQEQGALRHRLEHAHAENMHLAALLEQQEQLIQEAQSWLAQFEQRHLSIQKTYAQLTGEPLIVQSSS
jgi:Mg2+ and Co2+ transporter CorA